VRTTVCPEVGELRRSIDEPVSEIESHVVGCEACREAVEELRENARFAATALAAVGPTEDEAASATARAPRESVVVPMRARRGGWRYAAAGLAAAVAVAVVATVPAAQTAAAQFLAQFRSQRFAAVQVDPASGQGVFAHFKDLGVIQESGRQRPEQVATLAEASTKVGFALKQADPATLPTGIGAEPRIQVSQAHQLRFTFQKGKAQEYLRRVGQPNHPIPDKLDGATLVVNVPAGALMRYRGASQDEGVVVGQAGEVTAGVEGNATLEELRDYLLGLPGLPPEAVRQLRAIQDWRTTLPIPVPAANVSWQDTTVAGAPALMLADPTGLGSGVIWQRDGRIHGVAGNFRGPEILRVANGLR
jgi:hypothetical protein